VVAHDQQKAQDQQEARVAEIQASLPQEAHQTEAQLAVTDEMVDSRHFLQDIFPRAATPAL
jgi:hypothetical protein